MLLLLDVVAKIDGDCGKPHNAEANGDRGCFLENVIFGSRLLCRICTLIYCEPRAP